MGAMERGADHDPAAVVVAVVPELGCLQSSVCKTLYSQHKHVAPNRTTLNTFKPSYIDVS